MQSRHPFELTVDVSAADHALGPVDAPVTLVEYGDFECPHCKQAAPALKLFRVRFGDRLRLVYRHFPLDEVHPRARRAAEAAECAGEQGKFWEMHDALFEHQPHLADAELKSHAERLGLDLQRFDEHMRANTFLPRVLADQRSGAESGARSTPTFFINGRILDASYGLNSLPSAIEAALKK